MAKSTPPKNRKPPFPKDKPTALTDVPPGPWEATQTTQAPAPDSPDVPPPLPENKDAAIEQRWFLEYAAKQYKPSMPSMKPGPFDPPIMVWRLYQRSIAAT